MEAMNSIWGSLGVMAPLCRQRYTRCLIFLGPKSKNSFVPPIVYCSNNDGSLPKHSQLGYDPSEEILGLQVDLKSRNVMSGEPKLRSWFGPNGQYIRELPCPSCRGRGYTPCTECGIERSGLDCPQCSGKGIMTCCQCLGDCVIWEESIDERPWEKARSIRQHCKRYYERFPPLSGPSYGYCCYATPCISPVKVKEDDEVDGLEIKLDKKKKSKRVYRSPPPEVGLKISRSLKSLNAKTGLFSKRMKIIHRDPMLRAQRVAAIKKAKGTAAARKCASEALRAFFSDPENRRKRSIAMKGVKFYCKICGREGHRKHYCPELDDSSIDRRFRCRMCGEKGHNRRTCPKSRTSNHNGGSIRQLRCRICHQNGHNRRTCPLVTGLKVSRSDTKGGLVLRQPYRCQLCQERGHNRRTCPTRNTQPATMTVQYEEDASKHIVD